MRCQKRGLNLLLLQKVIEILQETGSLPSEYKPHLLPAICAMRGECHVKPDGLLIWEQDDKELTLLLLNTGTHSDLF